MYMFKEEEGLAENEGFLYRIVRCEGLKSVIIKSDS